VSLESGEQDAFDGFRFLVQSLQNVIGAAPNTRLTNSDSDSYWDVSFPETVKRPKNNYLFADLLSRVLGKEVGRVVLCEPVLIY
jgi:hypothetical protein